MQTFIILGYGIPKKIEDDDNYRRYLGITFNAIFSSSQNPNEQVAILFCGGLTDMFKPYRRTEAQEMFRLFKAFADRNACRNVTKKWKYFLEKKSLSSLENLVYAKQIFDSKKIETSNLTIFCEATRGARIKRNAKRIFGKTNVVIVDFDLSENRYIDLELIKKREQATVKLDDWALESPEHLKEFRKLFVDKFTFLRKAGPAHHQEALRAWWKKRLDELK